MLKLSRWIIHIKHIILQKLILVTIIEFSTEKYTYNTMTILAVLYNWVHLRDS